jgi:hypothetical protein
VISGFYRAAYGRINYRKFDVPLGIRHEGLSYEREARELLVEDLLRAEVGLDLLPRLRVRLLEVGGDVAQELVRPKLPEADFHLLL